MNSSLLKMSQIEEDDAMFELAKRLHCRRSPPALKVLCLDHIVNKWESWIALSENLQINIFYKISPLLRNDIVAHLSASKSWDWKQREFLYLLLNAETKILDLENWKLCVVYENHQQVAAFFEQLVLKAPNLEYLSFNSNVVRVEVADFDTRVELLQQLGNLKSLQHLSLNGAFELTDDELIVLTKNLKNLVCFKVMLSLDISLHGFQHFFQLDKLEEFHFFIWSSSADDDEIQKITQTSEWIYSWCAQCFPQLKLIAGTIEDCQMYDEEEPLHYSEMRHVSPKFRCTSQLESLHVLGNLPEATFPNLKKLFFYGVHYISNVYTNISSFVNLSHLGFKSTSQEKIDKILELVGHQLSNLYFDLTVLENRDGKFDLYKILFLCPNLVEIVHQICDESVGPVFNSKFQELVTKHNFRRLRKVALVFEGNEIPEGLLELIVQAPLIKIIHFYNFEIRKEDCQLVRDVVEGRFRQLEKVIFERLNLAPGCSFQDVGLMVKNFVCGAPNLQSICVDWGRVVELENLWKIREVQAIKFMDMVNCKNNSTFVPFQFHF